jgi:hypothetical protein
MPWIQTIAIAGIGTLERNEQSSRKPGGNDWEGCSPISYTTELEAYTNALFQLTALENPSGSEVEGQRVEVRLPVWNRLSTILGLGHSYGTRKHSHLLLIVDMVIVLKAAGVRSFPQPLECVSC